VETKSTLDQGTVDTLQDLVRVCVDTAKGLKAAADTVKTPAFANFLREVADERASHAIKLREYIHMNDNEANDHGSIRGALRRWWLDCRGALNGGDDHVVLNEAQRGEEAMKKRYEEALKAIPGSAMEPELREQYEAVKASCHAIGELRDELKQP